MLAYCYLDPGEQIGMKFASKYINFHVLTLIIQGCVTVWLSQCQRSDPGGYGMKKEQSAHHMHSSWDLLWYTNSYWEGESVFIYRQISYISAHHMHSSLDLLWCTNFYWEGESVFIYRQISYIRRTIVGNQIVDHSDVVGAAPVGAAPTTSSFSTWYMASIDWAKTTARRDEKHLSFFRFGAAYIKDLTEYWKQNTTEMSIQLQRFFILNKPIHR